MNDPKVNINVMPGAQMNGYVKEQHNYFGNIQQIANSEIKKDSFVDAAELKTTEIVPQDLNDNNKQREEDICIFVHPAVADENDQWMIHDEIKRLVSRQSLQMIISYLKDLAKEKKILLPPNPSMVYEELVRMGMPNGEGFSEKHFKNSYNK